MTFRALGYAREGVPCGSWSFSIIGIDSAWDNEQRSGGSEPKGKLKRSDTVASRDLTVLELNASSDSAVIGVETPEIGRERATSSESGYAGEERETEAEREARRERAEREEEEYELRA